MVVTVVGFATVGSGRGEQSTVRRPRRGSAIGCSVGWRAGGRGVPPMACRPPCPRGWTPA